jgi:hypothetical protein
MKERGHDVPAVSLWREVKEQARQVAQVAEELAGQVRGWIDRTAERARERLQPERPELARAGGGIERPADLAAQMRAAWEERQSRGEGIAGFLSGRDRGAEPEAEREDSEPRSLADRMREAAKSIDREAATVAAERVRTLREGREADRQQKEMQEREAEKQRQQEQERSRGRGIGMDFD